MKCSLTTSKGEFAYNDAKIEELNKKKTEIYRKKLDLTRDLDSELAKVNKELIAEENRRTEWLRQQKEMKKRKHVYMNLIFKWDNGIEFDTRKLKKLNEFKDYIFAYGLPTGFEVRG